MNNIIIEPIDALRSTRNLKRMLKRTSSVVGTGARDVEEKPLVITGPFNNENIACHTYGSKLLISTRALRMCQHVPLNTCTETV